MLALALAFSGACRQGVPSVLPEEAPSGGDPSATAPERDPEKPGSDPEPEPDPDPEDAEPEPEEAEPGPEEAEPEPEEAEPGPEGAAPGPPPPESDPVPPGPPVPGVLWRLDVRGGGRMYPAFASDVHHYALHCDDRATLRIVARAGAATTRLTLRRKDPDSNHVAMHALDVRLTVDADHDIVLELSDGAHAATYVVHCLPRTFPDIKVRTRTAGVSDGLLLITPEYHYCDPPLPPTTCLHGNLKGEARHFIAMVDNNGVPRYHRRFDYAVNFRSFAAGSVLGDARVRYAYSAEDRVVLLDADLNEVRQVMTAAGLDSADPHDYTFTETGNAVLLSWHSTTHDLSDVKKPDGTPYSKTEPMTDAIIQEVSPAGTEVAQWNSWDLLTIDPDCRVSQFPINYSHGNSLQVVDGDVIASYRGCAQVVRIDRSSGTGVVEWKLGGSAATRHEDTEFLEIVGDPLGEFCGQHQATLTDRDTVVLFDNGVHCLGPRKSRPSRTRVVEYDISSGSNAVFRRHYQHPSGLVTVWYGGVTVLANGHWLITWGPTTSSAPARATSVSEVDAAGNAVFEMVMLYSGGLVRTYRAYRETVADIPLNLP